jgi:hypothetical protein
MKQNKSNFKTLSDLIKNIEPKPWNNSNILVKNTIQNII